MATTQQPVYQAYSVIKREGQDDYWLSVGAAFPHKDGRGFNVVLQAMPLNGKIVLRPPKEQDKPDERSTKTERRSARRRDQ